MSSRSDNQPTPPDVGQRMPVVVVASPHPSTVDPDALLSQCELRMQPRGGPGGQHRNRTSSGVFLTHVATGMVAEATERRRQNENRGVALRRMRFLLAVAVRTPSILDQAADLTEQPIRTAFLGSRFRVGDRNESKPGLIALVLNDLHAAGGQPSIVSDLWKTSTSAVVRLVKTYPPAFGWLNQVRSHHQRPPLK